MLSFVRHRDRYYRVHQLDLEGVFVYPETWTDIEQIWSLATHQQPRNDQATLKLPWEQLECPLPTDALKVQAYGLTYPNHQDQVDLHEPLVFAKNTPPQYQWGELPWRPYLDFELEIGVLLSAKDPERFGYILVNDWTDRYLQVMTYNPKNIKDSFSKSKSFPNSTAVGAVLAIGAASLWPQLTATLHWNHQLRQTLMASDCIIEPKTIWETQAHGSSQPWLLVASGTPAGTLFTVPNLINKTRLFLTSGLSFNKAKKRYIDEIGWLKQGDSISIESPQLGRLVTTLI